MVIVCLLRVWLALSAGERSIGDDDLTLSGQARQDMLDWNRLDTVLLDMDGTILDLAFDNYFWRELIPRCLARSRSQDLESSRRELMALYASREGSLDWYCVDYWTDVLDLDLRALKVASSHRIRFLPGAPEFLARLSGSGRRVVLVTNAHGATLQIKRGVAGLDRFFESFVSSHDIGHAKEHPEFWPELQTRLDFDPDRTLFVDDSLPVLNAAAGFGLGEVIAVRRPDSRVPARDAGEYRSVESVAELSAEGIPRRRFDTDQSVG
jgi:HAD superfamily hydrolase (TIGR01509 family)